MLLEEPDRRTYLRRFRRPNLENIQRQSFFKAVNAAARKIVYCPYCAATNGAVKKAGALKIIHDKFRAKKTAEEMEAWKKTFASAVEAQKELSMYINKAVHEDLNPLKVLDLFKRISNEVIPLFTGDLSLLTRLPGLRTPWVASGTWPSGGIYLAVHLCATRMHSTICCSRRRIKRRRPHGEAYGNRLHKRSHKTGFGKGCSDCAIHGMIPVFLS